MPRRLTLSLTDEQRAELVRTRDRDRRPYLREKAAALLKIAEGQCPYQVARFGLLKPRDPDTLYSWLRAFQEQGRLLARPPCRGAFSPSGCGAPNATGDTAPTAAKPQSLDACPDAAAVSASGESDDA